MKILILIVCALLVVVFLYDVSTSKAGDKIKAGSLSGLKTAFQSEREAREEHTANLKAANDQKHGEAREEVREKINLALQRQQYMEDAEEAVNTAKAAVAEVESWQKTVVPLLTNGKGRTLARNNALLIAFETVYSVQRPSLERARFICDQAETMYSALKKAKFEKVEEVSEIDDPFRDWVRKAKEILDSYHSGRMQVEGLLIYARGLPAADAERFPLQTWLDGMERLSAARSVLPAGALVQPPAVAPERR